MNIRNWFFLFLGASLGVVVYGIISNFVNDDAPVKDLLPSIITGIVTFAALAFGYLNNKEQREVLLETTVEKEWIEKVRAYLATCVVKSIVINSYHFQQKPGNTGTITKIECDEATTQFVNSHASLSFYLNFQKPPEDALYKLVTKLWGQCNRGEIFEVTKTIEHIQTSAQNLLNDNFESAGY